MKFSIFFLSFFFTSAIIYSQELSALQIYQISKYNFEDLDELMINKHGFKRMQDLENENQKIYSNDSFHSDNLMVITVIKNNERCSNVLSIVNNSAESVHQLKKDLPLAGFQEFDKKKMSDEIVVSHFVKDEIKVLVTDEVTSTGAYQIVMMCRY